VGSDSKMKNKPMITFLKGSIRITGLLRNDAFESNYPFCLWDEKKCAYFAEALHYRELITFLHNVDASSVDAARNYEKLSLTLGKRIALRPHQKTAFDKWHESGGRGVVSLPTGAGKTILAVQCIELISRPTLVVVPTLDLLRQWVEVLNEFLNVEVGMLGGGERNVQLISVATYDTAALMIESLGDKFGFLIFDECHHLPSPQYSWIAKSGIAPFRLGLSATVERPDGKEEIIYQLLGPKVCDVGISEMTDNILSPYDVVTYEVPLSDNEHLQYQDSRKVYLGFLRKNRISLSGKGGWAHFLKSASYLPGGKEAIRAYRLQKKIAEGSEAKLGKLWSILCELADERIIVFTNDNELAYRIGSRFILPVLTHRTKASERKRFLEMFRSGELKVLVTSKVLNEGVDVPEASVAVVVSGSSTTREHVQRLGRVLRHKPGKRAVLYELISRETAEKFVSERRNQHDAYQGTS